MAAFDFKGPGTHYARLNISDQTVSIVAVNRLVSSNYVGAGVWTLNPVVATIVLPSGKNYSVVVYNPHSVRWMVFGNSHCSEIDANPNSPTFATIVAGTNVSGTLTGTWTVARIMWPEPVLIGWAATNGFGGLYLPRYEASDGSIFIAQNLPVTSGQPIYLIYDYVRKIFWANFGTSTSGFKITEYSPVRKAIGSYNPVAKSEFNSAYSTMPVCHPMVPYIYFGILGNYAKFDLNYRFISSFSILGIRTTAHCFLPNEPFVYHLPNASLQYIKWSVLTDSLITSFSISPVETETAFRQCAIDPLKTAVIADAYNSGSSANLKTLHIFNPNTDTYVGYVTVGNTAGNILRQIGSLNAIQNY